MAIKDNEKKERQNELKLIFYLKGLLIGKSLINDGW